MGVVPWATIAATTIVVGLIVAVVVYARKYGKADAQRDTLDAGRSNRERVDEILSEPVPLGQDLRDRQRARLRRAVDRMRDRIRE